MLERVMEQLIPILAQFKPDMTWFKRRDGTVNHVLYDSVRGYGDASNY